MNLALELCAKTKDITRLKTYTLHSNLMHAAVILSKCSSVLSMERAKMSLFGNWRAIQMSSVNAKQVLELFLHLLYKIRIKFKRYDCLLATREKSGVVKYIADLSDRK